MAPSQLKRLKNSLREQGIVRPQKSKKQKRQASKNDVSEKSRIQRDGTLRSIREQFNPFDIRATERTKFEVANPRRKTIVRRPGVSKETGEQNRRKTLLVEIQRRKKVGGIVDRRFGENNPSMTPEEKAIQRFVREREKGTRKSAVFDLEDPEEDAELQYFGQSLSFGNLKPTDDFQASDLSGSEANASEGDIDDRPAKRRRYEHDDLSESGEEPQGQERAERPKSKKEAMEEVIAKSKFLKYERQKAREDDDDLRTELDKGLSDFYVTLRGKQRNRIASPKTITEGLENGDMNPDRLALLEGKDRSKADQEYDQRLRQMAIDKRAQPTLPTMTEEEQLEKQAQILKELEARRVRRMHGNSGSSESGESDGEIEPNGLLNGESQDTEAFGIGNGLSAEPKQSSLDVEDEDEFFIEDDLITNDYSDASSLDETDNKLLASYVQNNEDEEFLGNLLSGEDAGRTDVDGLTYVAKKVQESVDGVSFVFQCPETHAEFLQIAQNASPQHLPTIIQRIRALYHPKLASDNKLKLARFASVLVDHIHYLGEHPEQTLFIVLETLIRHVHSLAKMFPEDVGRAFRSYFRAIQDERSDNLSSGDLVLFTAIGSVFPTSDHFHQVVTPAMLCMTRYLNQKLPQTLEDLTRGTYVVTLCLHYQKLAKRYVPEVVDYLLNTLTALIPSAEISGDYLRSSLAFTDTIGSPVDGRRSDEVKHILLRTQIELARNMANLWSSLKSFCEIVDPVYHAVRRIASKVHADMVPNALRKQARLVSDEIHNMLLQSLSSRKPLRLHNHRPLPLKTSIPKFEESYNPDRHYDPDPDRAAQSKLKAEHKKERKGALRELRKDASFTARQNLRERKEKDEAYDKKFKRLVAEIQGEEGHEAKAYEQEKRLRKGKK
ncbi:uncharacterized protein KY384_008375 [Bacidia gigantensis]|uniref:uncharacterized protein n=1 Tax=Bacidia gigantensis TaxID=2732470 RepID=UPI001D050F1F|nr:uncharacterized protein KY384_008375 [Bacidia gigantensis]KAG8526946.1 hypothetical protein KY384_008375 [Bacidia gigantensis]